MAATHLTSEQTGLALFPPTSEYLKIPRGYVVLKMSFPINHLLPLLRAEPSPTPITLLSKTKAEEPGKVEKNLTNLHALLGR